MRTSERSAGTRTLSVSTSLEDASDPTEQGWRLVELWDGDGQCSDREWPIDGRMVVGRTADISLNHATVSRRHLRVQPSTEGPWCVVENLSSSNGTRVNRQAVDLALLKPGDVLKVGSVLLAVDRLPPPMSPLAEAMNARSAALRWALARLGDWQIESARVLVEGETGVGKQVLAERVHEISGVEGDLILVDCARLAPDLAVSELFGHIKGAFTGAVADRDGLVVQADGGTLFLDEIGTLHPDCQQHLLKVLEQGEVRPVGADAGQPVEFRLICATNASLDQMAAQGTFRADLLARIEECTVVLPPLSRRTADIPQLLRANGIGVVSSSSVREVLASALWPRNARQLLNTAKQVRSAKPTSTGIRTLFRQMPRMKGPAYVPSRRRPQTAEEARQLLAVMDGSAAAVGRQLGFSRQAAHSMLKGFGLR